MKQTLTTCLALILLVTGCSKHVDPPPANADSIETLRTFLDAVIADDEKTGQHIAGPCWHKVKKWFNLNDDRIIKYEIPDDTTPRPSLRPHTLSTSIGFRYWDASGKYQDRMVASLQRDDGNLPWWICGLSYEYAP